MRIVIKINDINCLSVTEVTAIYTRLSKENSNSDSSIRKELRKRYIDVQPGPHPEMEMATIRIDDVLAGWVGTRLWTEKFKGETVTAQTVECFVAPEFRRRGVATMGLQALITAKKINRNDFVAVYAPEVVQMATQCGCKTVLLCEAT